MNEPSDNFVRWLLGTNETVQNINPLTCQINHSSGKQISTSNYSQQNTLSPANPSPGPNPSHPPTPNYLLPDAGPAATEHNMMLIEGVTYYTRDFFVMINQELPRVL